MGTVGRVKNTYQSREQSYGVVMRIGITHNPLPSLVAEPNQPASALAESTAASSLHSVSVQSQLADGSTREANAVQCVAAAFNEKLKKADLSAGNIFILIDQPESTTRTHKLIKIGRKLPSLSLLRNNKGDPALVHVVMWSKRQKKLGESRNEWFRGVGDRRNAGRD